MIVLGIVFAILSVYIGSANEKKRQEQARTEINSIIERLKKYEEANGEIPVTNDCGYGLGGEALHRRFDDPLFADIPHDPWGRPYRYQTMRGGSNTFRVWSCGPNRRNDFLGDDDVGEYACPYIVR